MEISKRNPYWDNFKGVLIILVVFAHFLWAYRDIEFVNNIVKGIYIFHMPAFVFVSGYLSKVSEHFPVKSILQLFISYVLINSLMMAYNYFILGKSLMILKPYYSCWYIIALIWWRIVLPFLKNYKYTIVFAVLLALTIGFSSDINNNFALSRTIAFFPFFLGGYLLKRNHPLRNTRKGLHYVSGFALVIIALLISYLCIEKLHITTNDEMMVAYGNDLFLDSIRRVVIWILAAFMITGLILIIPTKEIALVTKWGKNSLTIYLFHRIFPLLLLDFLPAKEYQSNYLIILSVSTLIILWLFGSNFIAKKYQNLITSISDIIMTDDSHKEAVKKHILLTLFMAFIILVFFEQKTEFFRSLM